jgi:hypothetical protein
MFEGLPGPLHSVVHISYGIRNTVTPQNTDHASTCVLLKPFPKLSFSSPLALLTS